MSTDNPDLPDAVRASWHRFADTYEPLRGELYRYCRHLTRSPWDAEDLAQDTMSRAFAALGRMGSAPPNPRAWLFRVASNLWLDHVRRPRLSIEPAPTTSSQPIELRDAAGTLLVQLAPQERAAVVLKDAFGFSLEEVAGILRTTVGAVKAALHRGRGKLLAPEVDAGRAPARGVVDAFCAAFNARDIERLTALLLDMATVEVVGATASYGTDETRNQMLRGMLFGSERLANAATQGGIEARFVGGALPTPPRAETRIYRGEAIALLWYAHQDGEHVRAINRFEVDGDRVVHMQNYFFTPDLIAEVCTELGISSRPNGYRWWLSREGCP
ncbi:RNA polymerase sigma factor [Myxococcus sp. RHSTA-1-4]|uniref:RNA polymerase sigma factor n=1 Tax=Myxococcus sp. RHSTA-1-4 TaxID=2874601 RepID=UPI001CBBEDFC|nr:RNA polymerase sigma factor [Myxococcus sp. RHSTA-1-4]MBZ4416701.1 RNA polymerase sigma factor [Myxococcus sp. RHSTA-1-4]